MNNLFGRNEFSNFIEIAMKDKYSRLFESKYIDKYKNLERCKNLRKIF